MTSRVLLKNNSILSLKLSCHILFMHAKNAWALSDIDTYNQAAQTKPRAKSARIGKKAQIYFKFALKSYYIVSIVTIVLSAGCCTLLHLHQKLCISQKRKSYS